MAVSINCGPLCGCRHNKNPTAWGVYIGGSILGPLTDNSASALAPGALSMALANPDLLQ